jgi:hypothetical protein
MFAILLFLKLVSVLDFAIGGGVGFVVGAFTPAVGRKIKAFLSSEVGKAVNDAKAAADAAAKKV